MLVAADRLEFEKAALLRDQIAILKKGVSTPQKSGKTAKRYADTPMQARKKSRKLNI